MHPSHMHVFDETVHLSNAWLIELMQRLGIEDQHVAYRALRATLHALRDQMTPAAAARFAAQLPILLRGVFFEGWRPRGRQRVVEGDFLGQLAQEIGDPTVDATTVARAVMALMAQKLSMGEVGRVVGRLPPELREIWVHEEIVLTPPAPMPPVRL